MFFKTLEIQGFKSFPEKTILEFNTKMTAVIGSNGNGKSNISDALRWVMGEQGAKTLRGHKMEDVIFHGTQSRKQMGYAKVALTIDNADRALNCDSDEVIITRKLYRTGDSECLINGAKCRLRDIHELLMGTGLGRDGYSIIGQGRVAEIVNSKGKERRETFDEAAGVSKFLHKKEQSQRELARSEENILRLMDIENVLAERLPVLQKQAEKALKAKALTESERNLEISLSVAQIQNIDDSLYEIENAVLSNQGECEHFEREIYELEILREEKSKEKMSVSAKTEELRSRSEQTNELISEKEKEATRAETEIEFNVKRIAAIKEQIEISNIGVLEFEREIEKLNSQISGFGNKSRELKSIVEKNQIELSEFELKNSQIDDEYKLLDKELSTVCATAAKAEISLKQARDLHDELTERLKEEIERLDNRQVLLDTHQKKKRELSSQLNETLENINEVQNKLNGYAMLFAGKEEKLNALKAEHDTLTREKNQKKSRYDALCDIEKNMTGYHQSVKSVLKEAKAGRLSGIYGSVADIIKVAQKYTVAIETALGAALQNVIVENEETAKRCIRFLKENNAGRATFLPLTSVRGNALNVPGLANEDGFLGAACDLVEYDKKFDGVTLSVLGKTAVCEDIDIATFTAKKYGYKFKIVTLDGQVINAGGSFTGGSVKESAGIISRKQEIETLAKELTKIDKSLETSDAQLKTLTSETAKMAIEIEGYKEEAAELKNAQTRLSAEISGVTELIRQCEDAQDTADVIISRHQKAIEEKLHEIENHTTILTTAEAEIADKTAAAQKLGDTLQERVALRAGYSAQISSLNIEIITLEKDAENLKAQIENAQKSKRDTGENNEKHNLEIQELSDKNGLLTEQINTFHTEIEEIRKNHSQNRSEIAALIENINLIEKKISEINNEISEKHTDKEKFSNALVLAKERKEKADSQLDGLKSGLWEKYEISPSEAKKIATPIENLNAAKSELSEVRKKLNALGAVNFAAVEELEQVEGEYAVLSGQLDDVKKAKRELEKLIDGLTTDITARFIQSFNEINKHFGQIFTEIFGGGSAHLELNTPDDVLNSGIEIYAAPPGKVIKNLISLSGGEQTMVAITIYFAILLHRPTPFCMLDEVDAALDDANISKYVSYLKRFSSTTQLMLITHRRGTIEECDVLYGVYMQEKGVSRLLKQELSDLLTVDS
ncbi:MAG: chromosome segregation protein SMC [Oscillospiraceae bacterium]|nr:chromosome segregation protein SMC [Oscillospiraceae bacterium]